MRTALVLLALSVVTPAFAQPVNLVVQNLSTDTIESINVFAAGVETSVGTYTVPIAPGQAGRVELTLAQCQPIEARVRIKDNPSDLRQEIDLCTDPLLTVGE